jgi:hypothetical protein
MGFRSRPALGVPTAGLVAVWRTFRLVLGLQAGHDLRTASAAGGARTWQPRPKVLALARPARRNSAPWAALASASETAGLPRALPSACVLALP